MDKRHSRFFNQQTDLKAFTVWTALLSLSLSLPQNLKLEAALLSLSKDLKLFTNPFLTFGDSLSDFGCGYSLILLASSLFCTQAFEIITNFVAKLTFSSYISVPLQIINKKLNKTCHFQQNWPFLLEYTTWDFLASIFNWSLLILRSTSKSRFVWIWI